MNIFQPIVSFIRAAVLKLSQLDKKEGLSLDDFARLLSWIQTAQSIKTGGQDRAKWVADTVRRVFGDKVPGWTVDLIVWGSYLVAKRKGMLE